MSTYQTSDALFETSFNNASPQGLTKQVNQINSQGPVLIYLPGDNASYSTATPTTDMTSEMNKLSNVLKHSLESANLNPDTIKQTAFYTVAYHIPSSFNEYKAADLLYKKHGRTKGIAQEDAPKYTEENNPAYIESLYKQIIEPRISRLEGKMKLDAKTAAQNVGQLVFFAHCFGTYTALKLGELMEEKMQKLGYKADEITQIQKQINVIAYAPVCPLGVSKINMVSFKTLGDNFYNGGNHAHDYMNNLINNDRQYHNDMLDEGFSKLKPTDFKLSFYPDKLGNVFLIKEKFTYDPLSMTETSHAREEHNRSFNKGDNQDAHTFQQLMQRCLANALLRAHKMQTQLLTPAPIRDLAVGEASQNKATDNLTFKQACLEGKKQYNTMLKQLKTALARQFQSRLAHK